MQAPNPVRYAFCMKPSRLPLTVVLLGLSIVIAALLNGGASYLKRVGVLEQERYAFYTATQAQWSIRSCDPPSARLARKPDFSYLFETNGPERGLKALKDLVSLALIFVLAVQVLRHPALLPRGPAAWPLYALLGLVAAAGVTSWVRFGEATLIVAGLRSLYPLPLALGGRGLAGPSAMGFLASCLMALALVQLPLSLFEAWAGLPIVREMCLPIPLATRSAGSFVHPNTLGVFVACAVFFYQGWGPPLPRRGWLGVLAAAVATLLLAGSATGLVVLAAAGAVWGLGRRRVHWAAAALPALALIGLFAVLPQLLGRSNLLDSLGGRMGGLLQLWQGAGDGWELWFGQGLGTSTGTAITLLGEGWKSGQRHLAMLDSTLGTLIAQFGLIGALAFFGLLAIVFLRDPPRRPFYAAIALSGLTINVTEVFPLNLALGLALAASLARIGQGPSGVVVTPPARVGAGRC